MDTDAPTLTYWHVFVDDAGVSRQERRAITNFGQQSMGGAAPQWNAALKNIPARAMFSVLPVGWTGDWHENPAPQWIVPLSGRWFVETMDGTRVEMGAGEVSFGGDQGCVADANGHKGHRSGTVGDTPAVLMIVQMDI
ncbi:MAG: cupin domain-containing protein [Rhodanobacteraceae bacterium]|nr:MAG: cupin domain-containing protein [Rhodanobacteraceae bacterium]